MAKKARSVGPHGTDRFTSNGYGITVAPLSEEHKKRVAEVNAEIAARQKAEKAKKKKK